MPGSGSTHGTSGHCAARNFQWQLDVMRHARSEIAAVIDFLDTLPDSSLSGLDVLEIVSAASYAMLPDHVREHRVIVVDADGSVLEETTGQYIDVRQKRRSYSVNAEPADAAVRHDDSYFKAVCILSASIGFFAPNERLRAMRRAAGHLPLGGVFIVSIEHVLPQAPPTRVVQLRSGSQLIDEVNHQNRTQRRILRHGSREWVSESHLVTPADLAYEIRAAGMTVVKQQSTPDPDHPFHIRVVLGAINRAMQAHP